MDSFAWLHDVNVWKLLGATTFVLYERSTWLPQHYAMWVLFIAAALELLARLVIAFGSIAGYADMKIQIKPAKGAKSLEFEFIDMLYISINKVITAVFSYQAINWLWNSPLVKWAPEDMTLLNSLVALPILYIVYDLPYTLFHRALHHRLLYPFIHKHHHRQMVPTRGNVDAINVHPFEFMTGEYNHLFAAYCVAKAIEFVSEGRDGVHVSAVAVFVLLGGVLASLNHTRFDVQLGLPTGIAGVLPIFNVSLHDVHHHQYYYNYAQYIILWDWLFGTYKPYPKEQPGGVEGINTERTKVA